MYFDNAFWVAAAERALKTFFQTLAAVLGTDVVGFLSVDPIEAVTLAAAAGIISLVTSLASANIGAAGPSLVGEETTQPRTVVVEKVVEVPAAPRKAAAKKTAAKKTAVKKTATKK
jgi:hypothetical protein